MNTWDSSQELNVPKSNGKVGIKNDSGNSPSSTCKTEASGEVPRGEKMLYPGTDPESYISEYTLVYED